MSASQANPLDETPAAGDSSGGGLPHGSAPGGPSPRAARIRANLRWLAGRVGSGLVVLFLLWLLALAWPKLTGSERLMRIAAIALVLAIMLVRAFPK